MKKGCNPQKSFCFDGILNRWYTRSNGNGCTNKVFPWKSEEGNILTGCSPIKHLERERKSEKREGEKERCAFLSEFPVVIYQTGKIVSDGRMDGRRQETTPRSYEKKQKKRGRRMSREAHSHRVLAHDHVSARVRVIPHIFHLHVRASRAVVLCAVVRALRAWCTLRA